MEKVVYYKKKDQIKLKAGPEPVEQSLLPEKINLEKGLVNRTGQPNQLIYDRLNYPEKGKSLVSEIRKSWYPPTELPSR